MDLGLNTANTLGQLLKLQWWMVALLGAGALRRERGGVRSIMAGPIGTKRQHVVIGFQWKPHKE